MLRGRMAPTPSGLLHMGNAFNFILAWLLVRQPGGSLRLRIDDLDAPRMRPGYLEDIFESLAWLGLDWDEGPRSAEDHLARFSQQGRLLRYDAMIQRLIDTGRVFACDCSRAQIRSQSPDGQYPGTCRNKGLPLDEPGLALRLRTPEEVHIGFEDGLLGHVSVNLAAASPDFIIRRRDGLPAYHIASLADDLDYGISLIVRGRDLLAATAAQRYMAELLHEQAFPDIRLLHHELLLDEQGLKQSKSAGSSSLRRMRLDGLSAALVFRRFSGWMGWEAAGSAAELLQIATGMGWGNNRL
jgi:glutamyl/glutaminyl-tRNA synthetase